MTTDAYRVLRHEILHGTMTPGERLRIADLNERYRLGLTPIREALMRLASEGLVTWQSYRGARVAGIDIEEFRDVARTRRQIGRLCLTQAIELGDAAWEAEIMRSFHLLMRTPFPGSSDVAEAPDNWIRFHREFHYALIAACGSPWLLRFWETLADHSERYRNLRLLRSGDEQPADRDINREHEHIAQAVVARDTSAAIQLLDRHLTRSEAAVARLLEPDGE